MIRAGSGYSIATNPHAAAAEATASAMAQAGLPRAAAALCFATTAHGAAFPMILRAVAAEARTREVAGCSGMGVIGGDREIEAGPGVAVLVLGGEAITAQRLFSAPLRGRGADAARELASKAKPEGGGLLCLFPDTYNFEAQPFLATLARELPGVGVVGGGASEDGSIGETFQFCGDVVSSNAVAAILLSGDFEVNIGASLACSPIGAPHRVTAARDNVLIELDGRPAFEVFAEAVGPLADDLRRALALVFVGLPVDEHSPRLDRGSFIIRNIVGASSEQGVLAIAHQPRVGDTIALVLRDGERSRADLKATLEEMAARQQRTPALGLYFDCVSRGSGLYRITDHDSAYIRQYLGHFPLAGFFTGCEIGPIGAATGLLQYSGVLALVSNRG